VNEGWGGVWFSSDGADVFCIAGLVVISVTFAEVSGGGTEMVWLAEE